MPAKLDVNAISFSAGPVDVISSDDYKSCLQHIISTAEADQETAQQVAALEERLRSRRVTTGNALSLANIFLPTMKFDEKDYKPSS